MKKRIIIIVLLLSCWTKAKSQQDAQFSQYLFNGIYINPAYAGYKEQLNLHAFYRNQWTGITGSPQTMSFAIDATGNEKRVGLALQFVVDQLGAQRNESVYLNYAYRIAMNAQGSSRLALGLGFGAIQFGMDGAMLNPNDTEPNQPLGKQSVIVPDARVGIYFANNRIFAGLSAANILAQFSVVEHYAYIAKPRPHYYLTAGMLLPMGYNMFLKPSILLKDDRGGPTSLDMGLFAILNERFWIGGAYRTGIKLYRKDNLQNNLSNLNSVVASLQFAPSDRLRIGYAYDFSVGALQGYSAGTHELSVSLMFARKHIPMLSPRFF